MCMAQKAICPVEMMTTFPSPCVAQKGSIHELGQSYELYDFTYTTIYIWAQLSLFCFFLVVILANTIQSSGDGVSKLICLSLTIVICTLDSALAGFRHRSGKYFFKNEKNCLVFIYNLLITQKS